MSSKASLNESSQFSQKISIRSILVLSFLLQIIGFVGLTGWLSFRNGQRSIGVVTAKLHDEVSNHVKLYVENYLDDAFAINQINTEYIIRGEFNFNRPQDQHFLWQQSRHLLTATWVGCGSERGGEYVGVYQRDQTTPLKVVVVNESTDYLNYYYPLDAQGNLGTLERIPEDKRYDARLRPWYQNAVKSGQQIWNPVYSAFDSNHLFMSASQPAYNQQGELLGVCAVDFSLNHISQFLRTIQNDKPGQIFILERNGALVANSLESSSLEHQGNSGETRIEATESSNELMRATAQYLKQYFEDWASIQDSHQLEFKWQGERQFIQIVPLQDSQGLDWLMVMIIPELDFMEQIYNNNRNTILLYCGALGIAIILGFYISSWISKPIEKISQETRNFSLKYQENSNDNYHSFLTFEAQDIRELAILSDSLNQMSQQINDSFEILEERVEERTQELSMSEEKFAKAFRSSPHPMTITTLKDGRHLEVNQSFLETTGYPSEKVIGFTAVDLDLWVSLQARKNLFEQLKNNQRIRNYEFEFKTSSGQIRIALLSAEIINIQGELCLLSISNDITEQKRAEALLKKAKKEADLANKVKSEFLANMSHELRTPLNAILGFTRLLNNIPIPDQTQKQYLDIIGRSGEHLLSLINDVLDLSKIEAGRITLNENNFNLSTLLNTISAMLRLKVNGKGLKLTFDYASEIPTSLRADEQKIRQVLLNLLDNAIKFTPQGSVTLRIAEVRDRHDKKHHPNQTLLHFEVEDTGLGIAENELNGLFEAFVQTKTGRQSQEGTGLGLPISRQFVQLMGGELQVKSSLGKGTLFFFDIPVRIASTIKLKPQPRKHIIGLAPEQPEYRILVVDDQWENCHLLVNLLDSLGFKVKDAMNGQDAIALWESWKPHLIWMDLGMPEMDGKEATRIIRQQEALDSSQTQKTVIIALSASFQQSDRHQILAKGFDEFVSKPFSEQIIFETMATHLGVRYCYNSAKNLPLSIPQPLTTSTLMVMSKDWITQLNQAALEGDDEWILQLITQIPHEKTDLIHQLTHWTQEFRFDKIIDLINANSP